MTKLEPITSEEVLKRQVKERAQASVPVSPLKRSDPPITPSNVAVSSNNLTERPRQTEEKNDVRQSVGNTGFEYRMPLGSYLLSFLYLQVCAAALLSIAMTFIMSSQLNNTVNSLGTIQRESWGAVIIPLVFAFFIFSGNNTLRLMTVAGSSLLLLVLGYQMVSSVITFFDTGYSASQFMSFFSAFMSIYVILFLLGMLLLLTTIIYLLRKKVSAAYN